jgi:hypothetical protein
MNGKIMKMINQKIQANLLHKRRKSNPTRKKSNSTRKIGRNIRRKKRMSLVYRD